MDEEKSSKPITNSEQLNNLTTEMNPGRDFWEFLVDLLKTGAVIFLICIVLRYFVIQPYIVDGESMLPNYINREYLLAEKLSYLFGQPKRGDVVIFRYPKNPSVNYIKRIIGLPGEKVRVANNQVTIYNASHPDGVLLKEHYIPDYFQTSAYEQSNGVLEITLHDNEYFVLGDNREHSSDSREWGVLPKANILGRAWLTLVPLNRAGFHNPTTYSISEIFPTIRLALSPRN